MKKHNKTLFLFLTTLLALSLFACTQTTDDPRVEEFLNIYPGATKESQNYRQESTMTRDFFSQECSEQPPYKRTTYTQYGAQLTIYSREGDTLCALINIAPGELQITQGNIDDAPEGVAFVVNDEPILFSELETLFLRLSEQERSIENLNALANSLINQKLLLQETRTYIVNEEELLQELLITNNVTQEDFFEQLTQEGISREQYLKQLRLELGVQALLEDKFGAAAVVEDVTRQFYLENTDAFIRSEQATFQQIFVQEQDPQRAQTRIDVIARSLNNTDFCTVVTTYSDDLDSKERCGVYTIPRGVVFSELEYAVFNNPAGELFVVQGPQGYHLINVLERQPTSVMSYAQAQDIAKNFLTEEIQQLRLNAYLSTIRGQAKVTTYLSFQEQDLLEE